MNKKIILASQSPRRKELLQLLGYSFISISLDIDESYSADLQAEKITEYLVEKKADAYPNLQDNEILITADTLVWHQNKALEKPKTQQEAIEMILSMSNATHQVFSAVCIRTNSTQKIFTDVAEVSFSNISEEEAKCYVQQYQPFDKAGSYGIQDWIGLAKITTLNGSFYTVMGLPTHLLYEELKAILA